MAFSTGTLFQALAGAAVLSAVLKADGCQPVDVVISDAVLGDPCRHLVNCVNARPRAHVRACTCADDDSAPHQLNSGSNRHSHRAIDFTAIQVKGWNSAVAMLPRLGEQIPPAGARPSESRPYMHTRPSVSPTTQFASKRSPRACETKCGHGQCRRDYAVSRRMWSHVSCV